MHKHRVTGAGMKKAGWEDESGARDSQAGRRPFLPGIHIQYTAMTVFENSMTEPTII